ncbi:MAG: hypothetical protein Q8Q09_29705 [Deltaproteobacteria bacterium]|nr:hypothetical protein [Deltaproteobacteria bacterium]
MSPLPLLAHRIEAVLSATAGAGARLDGYLAAGFMTERQSATTVVDVPAGGCVSMLAVATPGIADLDARLYDEQGELLVEDVEPDSHPTLQICSREARRLYHVLQAFDGNGAFAIAQFSGTRAAMESVAHATGGRPGASMSTALARSELDQRAAELRMMLTRRGFSPSGDPARVSFVVPGAVLVPFATSADRCFTIAAMQETGELRLRLRVIDGSDEVLARDVRGERDAVLQFCPPSATPLRIELASSGPGSAQVLVFSADAAEFGAANALWLGQRLALTVSPLSLDARLAARRGELSALGVSALTLVSRSAMAAGESREHTLTLEPGQCSVLGALVGRGVGRVSAEVLDATAEPWMRSQWSQGTALTVHCPSARERVNLRVRLEMGTGEVGMIQGSLGPTPSWVSGLDPSLVAETLAFRLSRVSANERSAGPPERLRVAPRGPRARAFELPAGQCTRVLVSSGRPYPMLQATLRGPTGAELARTSRAGSVSVRHCVPVTTQARLEIELDPSESVERDVILQRMLSADEGTQGATP